MNAVEQMIAGAGTGTGEVSLARRIYGPEDDRCIDPNCGGQLAVINGPVMVPNRLAPAGSPHIREGSERDRRQSFVGCGTCGAPVQPDHPRQAKLDKEWEDLEYKEAKEKARAQIPNGARAPVEQANPLQYLERMIDGLRTAVEESTQQNKQSQETIARLDRRLAALESKKK